MSTPFNKAGLKIILPVLLAMGTCFYLVRTIVNVLPGIEPSGLKIICPDSYEFKIYDRLLKKYVKNGLVDYQSLKGDPDLSACYDELSHTSPCQLKGKLELLCFWINTYNLLTIKCIADSYPLKRLESTGKQFVVGGKLYMLSQVQQELLPPQISTSDWRAIFLLCDGSLSSPPIAAHAYTASRIGDEFEPAMLHFVLRAANYAFDPEANTFSISPFYRANLRYIDREYATPFAMVNDQLPRQKKVDLAKVICNYAVPYDRRLNDTKLSANREGQN